MQATPDTPLRTSPLARRSVVFVLTAVAFLLLAARFHGQTVDDAYIAYRYADHWAAGHGPVFNPGERVEGYTSFLWVALLALGRTCGVAPTELAPILGLLASLGLLLVVALRGPDPRRHPLAAWLAPVLVATSPVFGFWATAGLEIPLFAFLVTYAALEATRGIEAGRLSLRVALLCALAALTRPEGLGLCLLVLLWAALALPRGARLASLGRFLLVLALFLVPHELWRIWYYGYPLPNTYYAKTGGGLAQAQRGLAYAWRYVEHSHLAPAAVLLALPALRPLRTRGLVLAVGVAFVAAAVAVGGETMPLYRFLAPALPALWLASAWGWARAGERLPAPRARRVLAPLTLLGLAGLASLPAFQGWDRAYLEQNRREVEAWRAIGEWFARKAPPDATIGVVTAGAIPYFSERRALDLLGLNDEKIAHHPVEDLGDGPAGHERRFSRYVLKRAPEYLVLGQYGLTKKKSYTTSLVVPYFAAEKELLARKRFREDYVLQRARTPQGDFAYFARQDAIIERGSGQAVEKEDVWARDMPGLWAKSQAPTTGLAEEAAALERIGYAQGFEEAGAESGVVLYDHDRAGAGLNLSASGHAPEATLFDMSGEVLHRWSHAYQELPGADPSAPPQSANAWRRVALRPDGSLLAIYEGLGLVAVDRDSNLLWYHAGREHHDLEVLDDGRIRTLTRRPRLDKALDPLHPILEDFVTTLDPDGEVLSEVSVLECLRSSPYRSLVEEREYRSGDIFHTNTVETLRAIPGAAMPAFAPGNVLLSMRHLDAIVVVDLEKETAVWAATGSWRRQHQPTLLDDGNLLLFDNEGYHDASRVLELDPRTLETRWDWHGDPPETFFSIYCGSEQRLANGNTLITDTCSGRAFEVVPDGEVVWDYRSPHRAGEHDELVAALFEVVRLPADSPLLAWMR